MENPADYQQQEAVVVVAIALVVSSNETEHGCAK